MLPEKHDNSVSAGVAARAGYIEGEEEDSPGGAEPTGEEGGRVLNRIRNLECTSKYMLLTIMSSQ